ncbi:MAG TPA: hypothetical protein VMG41_10575 [Gemmatimonadales bacterium]|nr:hypothetical protein [Gemmatimonadales bacterium]
MTDFFNRPVFRVKDDTFTWRDIMLFTHRVGGWSEVLDGIADGLAGVRHAERLPEDEAEALEEAVDSAAAEFRYDRELITAEETEAWLAERGVTATEWLASVRREVARSQFANLLPELRGDTPQPPRQEMEEALRVDLSCTRLGQHLAERCAEQAAAAAVVGPPRMSSAPQPASPLPAGLDLEHTHAQLPLIESIVERVDRFRESVVSEEAVVREVRQHKMEWVRLECLTVDFPDLAQAKEAALCIREDGLEFSDVAGSAHREVLETRFYVDDLQEDLQSVLLSAMPGDVIGPTSVGESHTLFQVLSKTLPADSDPEVRARAEARLFARALGRAGREGTQWLVKW